MNSSIKQADVSPKSTTSSSLTALVCQVDGHYHWGDQEGEIADKALMADIEEKEKCVMIEPAEDLTAVPAEVTEGIGYNSHPPPYSKSVRFADMPAPHVPTPFACKLSIDDYIKASDSDSFASCAESDYVGSEDDCDKSSSKNALPFVPKSVNAMSCIANFKSAGVVVTDIPQESMSNLEFFRLKEDQSLQERLAEERVASSSDVSTSQSSSSSCDDNYQAKASCDKVQSRRTRDNIWHVDSGCSRNMTGQFSLLQDYHPMDGDFFTLKGNPRGGKIEGRGTMSNGVNKELILMRAPRRYNTYSLDMNNPSGIESCFLSKASKDESFLWHKRLGHVNFKTMNRLVRGNLITGLPMKDFSPVEHCLSCSKGKQHKSTHKPKTTNSIDSPLQLLLMDLFGPMSVMSHERKSYCLVVADDFSRFTWVFFQAKKDETPETLKIYLLQIKNMFNLSVKTIRSDLGTEFKNAILDSFSERRNRTLIEAARTMIVDSKLPVTFWAEAVNTLCFMQNRVLITKSCNKTPYEIMYKRKHVIDFFRKFGCVCTMLNTSDQLNKFETKVQSRRTGDNIWHVDSGCSRNMTGQFSLLQDYHPMDGDFFTLKGNPRGGKIEGRGTVSNGVNKELILMRAPRRYNTYSLDMNNPSGIESCFLSKASKDESFLWHKRLGHVNFKTMNRLVRGNLVTGLPMKDFSPVEHCLSCSKGKQHKSTHKPKTTNSIDSPLQLLHMDLFGPMSVMSHERKSYCLVVADDFSRFTWVFFQAKKDETPETLKIYLLQIKNMFNLSVKTIRSDHGTEFKNAILDSFSERRNRTLIEAARTMIVDSKLPVTFWAEAVNTLCFVQNRVLITKSCNKTPYEIMYKRKHVIDFFRKFGCVCTMLNTSDQLNKFETKVYECYFVGYSSNQRAFHVYNKRRRIMLESIDINWHESNHTDAGDGPDWIFNVDSLFKSFILPVFPNISVSANPLISMNNLGTSIASISSSSGQHVDVPPKIANAESTQDSSNSVATSETVKEETPPIVDVAPQSSAEDPIMEEPVITDKYITNLENNLEEDIIPQLWFTKIILQTTSLVHSIWESELQFNKLQVWNLVDLPKNNVLIGTRWVFRNKKDEGGIVLRNKARLVVQGFYQEEGIDFVEVGSHQNVSHLSGLYGLQGSPNGCQKRISVWKGSRGSLCQAAIGFIDQNFPDRVYKLDKAVYGLHQAPRA
ncbi:hypothetical protein L1987_15816 [Smallanthus sonchifolius]|uniref:Uncharacterized protein n=1 Tax=Smallanthus sonchifolius TaxID=185202 RepID=A0ACB9J7L8_9ASTR|nr:hypothetical protein L1987_15816 [Smallanthus sonchifolius]